jgi:SET domain-containing protein
VDREEPTRDVWVHGGVTVGRSAIDGDGLFATDDLVAATPVIRLAGRLVTSAELAELIAASDADAAAAYLDTITIYEDAHLVIPPASIVHFVNHCCDPNLWHVGPYEIAARRDVIAGEELTVDYGTNSGADGFSMACTCGSSLCRGQVSSDDWRRRELQDRYRGHWVPALHRRISHF